MKTFSFQAIGIYKDSEMGSALKQRDYKDATDLIVERGGGTSNNEVLQDDKTGGDGMNDVSEETIVRRLTPL